MKKIVRILSVAIVVCAILAVLAAVYFYTFDRLLLDLRETKRNSLELVTSTLRSEIHQFEVLSRVLASNSELQNFLANPDELTQVQVNRRLQAINQTSGALDTYLMDKSGVTLAASNWATESSFVGNNFSYRPYFQGAIKGHTRHFFAIGTTSKRRGFYIASPVKNNNKIIGAIVIKVQVDHLEQLWKSEQHHLSLLDESGVIFLSTNADWRLHSIRPLSTTQIQQIQKTRRYPNANDIPTLRYIAESTLNGADELANILDTNSRYPTLYLAMPSEMQEANWTVLLTTNIEPIRREAFYIAVVIGFGLAGIGIIAYAIVTQSRATKNRLARARSDQNRLEAAINERTLDLQNANDELLKTQQKLVQSGRLAAVGRFSAGLSHEIGQPLTAMHSYLSNAQQLIALGRYDDAGTTIESISSLADRITRIIQQLKIFVRGDPLLTAPVSLKSVVFEAQSIMQSQATKLAARIIVQFSDDDVHIDADEILVQQLVVNLLSNALDAAAESASPVVRLNISKTKSHAIIEVSDNGVGVSAEHLANIFDPFYTTKKTGRGMGLGLTIAQEIVNRFHGELSASNSKQGGAVFTVIIPLYKRKTR